MLQRIRRDLLPALAGLALALGAVFCTAVPAAGALAQGRLEKIRVQSPALAGNLQGNDAVRDVYVYLPPGYQKGRQRYPVVYFLHGYGVTADIYVDTVLHIPAATDAAMGAGAPPAIIVMPDAFTRFGGSFYSNSPTIGDWESWIARDLVAYIDGHYRTLARREGRGLSGHSMGGYGTLRIGMKYPQVFGAIYSMSAGALSNQAPDAARVKAERERLAAGIRTEVRSTVNGVEAQASAWAPNPQNPPWFFDLPFDAEGKPVPLVAEKWTANALLATVDQNVPALKSFRAIMLDVGNQDGLMASNTQFSEALGRLGVAHAYEVYDGTHGNRVGQRFIDKVLPFFARNLDAR
jgi:enterochelin esterase-like enzyme